MCLRRPERGVPSASHSAYQPPSAASHMVCERKSQPCSRHSRQNAESGCSRKASAATRVCRAWNSRKRGEGAALRRQAWSKSQW